MIKSNLVPCEAVVTTAAVCSESPLVRIDIAVAGIAVAVPQVHEVRRPMTGLAGEASVAANKGKSGFQFVVERDIRPLDCAVAVATTNAIAAFVNVLLLVAIVAGAANDSEIIVLVAALTLKPGMRAR